MVSLKALNKSIGQMRTFITVQRRNDVRDDATGTLNGEWVQVYQFWGAVEWTLGRDQENAMRVQPVDRCYIVARWDSRLRSSDRLMFKGNTVKIVGAPINVEERNHLMEINGERGSGT